MKHVFKDSRGRWRCISFARTKKRSYQSQDQMARRVSLQRASARAAASRSNNSSSGKASHRWMYKTFSALYSTSQRRFRTRDRLSKLKNRLLRSNSFDHSVPISSSSLAELIPPADFDFGNVPISSTDSDAQTTGVPPSRRSSDSLLSCNCESSTGPSSVATRSPFSTRRLHRKKRSVFRAAKLALSRHDNNGWERSAGEDPATRPSGIGRSKYTHGIATIKEKPGASTRILPTPENLSRGTSMTMDTSSSPCKSPTKSNSPGWQENNYDMLTETLSILSWGTSMRADPFMLEARPSVEARPSEWRPSVSRRPSSAQAYDKHDWLRRRDSMMEPKPGSPLAPPSFSGDLHRRQASAIKGAIHTLPGKDFQEAIVDIILENDVQDLIDLEEFLQDYFRLNSLYQDIIQQFFNDLSGDIVHAQVSRAPSVIARLASANRIMGKGIPSSARKSTNRRY